MLLWEALRSMGKQSAPTGQGLVQSFPRMPFQKQCAAVTRSGRRCKGRARPGQDHCAFHDPSLTPEQRREIAAKGGKTHRRLGHLPDGYLRKLQTPAAVGEAMDRLYREVRMGIIEPAMGRTLLDILTRLYDRLTAGKKTEGRRTRPTKADRVRPRLSDLLTQAELAAWKKVGLKPEAAQSAHDEDDHLHHPAALNAALDDRHDAAKPLVQIVRANAS
jgi:hypothetical protein